MNVFNDNRSVFNDSLNCFELLHDESVKCLGVFGQDLNVWNGTIKAPAPIDNLTEWQTLVHDALYNYGYGPFLEAVECWNEPDLMQNQKGCMNGPENYTEMLRILYNETKTYAGEYNKTIDVVAGSVVNIYSNETSPGTGALFIQTIKDLGSDDFCDAYSMHIYKGDPADVNSSQFLSGHTADEAYDCIKNITDANSTDPKPLWVSEMGTHDNTDKGQASQMQTWFKELASRFCPMVFWYNYIDPDEDIHGILETGTFKERPAFYVFQCASVARVYACLAVRGLDNSIYYRACNVSSRTWESWSVIPSGSTCDAPATTFCCGKLYFVVRGMDGQSLWFGSVNITDHSFSGWAGLTGASPSAPTLVCYGLKLVLVVRGLTNIIYFRSYDCVSETWTDWTPVPDGATCDSPAAAVFGSGLHLVVRGFSTTDVWSNNSLWHGVMNMTDNSFSGWTGLPGATPSAPRLAASGTLGKLCLNVRGMSDEIWINTWNGASWEGWTALPSGATCDSSAVTVVNGELHIVVRSYTGDALWHYYVNLSTEAHSGWMAMDGFTPSAPTLVG